MLVGRNGQMYPPKCQTVTLKESESLMVLALE